MDYLKITYAIIYIICTYKLRNVGTAEPYSTGEEYSEEETYISTAEECARNCEEGEPRKTCYYHFTLELYTVLGGACEICTPNDTNTLSANCQCVQADGVERGGILTANRMIPGPSIEVCEGDQVVIDVKNAMPGLEVSIHWHGIWQEGTQYYDGVPFVTQCPIHQGNTFRYQWGTENNAGTHFWHAHTGYQKLDGIYGSLIVRQSVSADIHSDLYDFDLSNNVILLSDWMHEMSYERFPGTINVKPGQLPENLLIRGKGQCFDHETNSFTNSTLESFTVFAGKRYRFRMINALALTCPAELTIENHTLLVIATDGTPLQPVSVNTIISLTGERYDFVVEANQPAGEYWIQVRALGNCSKEEIQQHAILRYESASYVPGSQRPEYNTGLPVGVVLNPLCSNYSNEGSQAVCLGQLKRTTLDTYFGTSQEQPDIKIYLPFQLHYYTPEEVFEPNTYKPFLVFERIARLTIDYISFAFPPSPLLSQIDDIPSEQFCNGDNHPSDCEENCICTNILDIPLDSEVEIILIDEVPDTKVSHAFHLHGYIFSVVGVGVPPNPEEKFNLTYVLDLDRRGLLKRELNLPPTKDTIPIPSGGYVILRFKANNPGYWLLHCHMLLHLAPGMNIVLHVGTHSDLPPVPPNFPKCGNFLPKIGSQYKK